jgi:hypothetical protein
MKLHTFLFTLLFIGFNLTIHAKDMSFDDWDADDDGRIERHEFSEKFIANYFNSWGAENEAGILEEGFFKQSYAGLDSDNDKFLSDEEWLVGQHYFYDEYIVYDEIESADINKDGHISYDEYYDIMYDTKYFNDIDLDSDNYISQYELANYIFDNWDTNESGTISRSEYKRFDWYYLDV